MNQIKLWRFMYENGHKSGISVFFLKGYPPHFGRNKLQLDWSPPVPAKKIMPENLGKTNQICLPGPGPPCCTTQIDQFFLVVVIVKDFNLQLF